MNLSFPDATAVSQRKILVASPVYSGEAGSGVYERQLWSLHGQFFGNCDAIKQTERGTEEKREWELKKDWDRKEGPLVELHKGHMELCSLH